MANTATGKKKEQEHLGLSTIKSETPKEILDAVQPLVKLDLTKVKITDQESHDKYVAMLQRIKATHARVDEYWAADIAAAHALHKSLCSKRNQLVDPLERLEKGLAQAIGAFLLEVEAREREAAAEAQERARKAAEQQRKAEVREAKASGAPKDVLDAMKTETLPIPKVEAPEIIQRAAGTSNTTRWKMELVSKTVLLKFCADNLEYAYLFDYNSGEGNRLAQRQNEILRTKPLPGTMIKAEAGFRSRTF